MPDTKKTPDDAAAKRSRRHDKKVRTGCLTCKKRRVKCDEAKPHCNRCLKGSYLCDGYASPSKSQYKTRLRSSKQPRTQSLTMNEYDDTEPNDIVVTNRSPTFTLRTKYGTQEEQRSFEFFLSKTSKRIARFSVTAKFWTQLIPNLSWQDPAIKHALVAVAMVDEINYQPSLNTKAQLRQRWITHYNAAIRALTVRDNPPLDVVLIVCILFFTAEDMSWRPEAAFVHNEYGTRLLQSWKQNQTSKVSCRSDQEEIQNHIEKVMVEQKAYAAGNLVERALAVAPKPMHQYTSSLLLARTLPEPPQKLHDFDHARRELVQIICVIIKVAQAQPQQEGSSGCPFNTSTQTCFQDCGSFLKQARHDLVWWNEQFRLLCILATPSQDNDKWSKWVFNRRALRLNHQNAYLVLEIVSSSFAATPANHSRYTKILFNLQHLVGQRLRGTSPLLQREMGLRALFNFVNERCNDREMKSMTEELMMTGSDCIYQ